MAKKQKHSAGHLAEAGDYVLVGSYAGSPFDWFIVQVVFSDPRDDEVCVRRSDLTGTEKYLQVLGRQFIRAVAKPTAMEIAAAESEIAPAVAQLVAFKQKAGELWGRCDETIADAEAALEAARQAKWATLDSLFLTEAEPA